MGNTDVKPSLFVAALPGGTGPSWHRPAGARGRPRQSASSGCKSGARSWAREAVFLKGRRQNRPPKTPKIGPNILSVAERLSVTDTGRALRARPCSRKLGFKVLTRNHWNSGSELKTSSRRFKMGFAQ